MLVRIAEEFELCCGLTLIPQPLLPVGVPLDRGGSQFPLPAGEGAREAGG